LNPISYLCKMIFIAKKAVLLLISCKKKLVNIFLQNDLINFINVNNRHKPKILSDFRINSKSMKKIKLQTKKFSIFPKLTTSKVWKLLIFNNKKYYHHNMLIKKNKFNRWIISEFRKTQIMEIRHKEVKT
jgi:hypothetical protein